MTAPAAETDARLTAIEDKLDQLLGLLDGLRARIECPPGCDAPGHELLQSMATGAAA